MAKCGHIFKAVSGCVCVFILHRRELRRKGKNRVPLKSKDWVLAKKQRKRNQGKYVE